MDRRLPPQFAQTILILWVFLLNRQLSIKYLLWNCWHFHCERIMIARIASFPLWESPHSRLAGWGQTGLLGAHLIHQECPPPSNKLLSWLKFSKHYFFRRGSGEGYSNTFARKNIATLDNFHHFLHCTMCCLYSTMPPYPRFWGCFFGIWTQSFYKSCSLTMI